MSEELNKTTLKPGDKVTYVTNHGTLENGVVKSIQSTEYAFVVYHCGGDWENYKNYTGAHTDINSLVIGWRVK